MKTSLARATSALPSAVHRGVAFEERSRRLLQSHLSMSLGRVGGKSDGGIDLQGWWWVPPAKNTLDTLDSAQKPAVLHTDQGEPRRRIRVLGQCKAETKKMGPNYVREMEGVLHTFMTLPDPSRSPTVALLISQSSFTRSTILRAMSSHVPFLLMHLPLSGDNASDDIGAAMWNSALSGEEGLLKGEAELRWERKDGEEGRPGLWWARKKLKNWVPPDETGISDVSDITDDADVL